MVQKRKKIGELLLEAKAITEDQLQKGLQRQKESGDQLGKAIIDLGFLTEHKLIVVLSDQLDIPYLFLDNYIFDQNTVKLIPEDYARHNKIIPLFGIEDTLTIGIFDPTNIDIIDELSRMTKMEIEPTLCAESEISEALDELYGTSKPMDDVLQKIRSMDKDDKGGKESPMIQLVEIMFERAVKLGASDIHIEPDEKVLRIRYRIDGILETMYEHPLDLQDEIISRVKVMSNLNITEKRLPQDGRFKMSLDGSAFDFRVSTLPTYFGENVVIRILDQGSINIELDSLGMSNEMLKKYKEVVQSPYGIILVTGPTGSGKTTTLYSAMNSLNSPEKNIVTIEDPVEYRLPYIRQTNVNPKIGLTFANGLRSILRQDPDIIMVGEIRDAETASIAVQAALTGHLVLSTLHTNDTVSSATRLVDMGVEPFLVASSTIAIVAQRLVRKICTRCKVEYEPELELLEDLNLASARKKLNSIVPKVASTAGKQATRDASGCMKFYSLPKASGA